MSEFNQSSVYSSDQDTLRAYILRVFTKMGIGLVLTAAVAYLCYTSLMNGGLI